jgi:hypothetical protein
VGPRAGLEAEARGKILCLTLCYSYECKVRKNNFVVSRKRVFTKHHFPGEEENLDLYAEIFNYWEFLE